MTDERPDALLKSALEKIIYFEARSEQLVNDLAASRAETERLRADLTSAAQREIGLRQELAEREVQLARAQRDAQERARLIDALTAERSALMGKLIEASQIQGAGRPEHEADFDLASFIAQLRSEVMAQQRGPQQVTPAIVAVPHIAESVPAASAPAPAPAPAYALATVRAPRAGSGAVEIHAERLLSEGRLQVSEHQVLELSRDTATYAGRTEETLFGFSLRELSAPEPTARMRAADRLRALKNPAAASALATALHAEREPAVRVALLNAFAQLARSEGAPVVAEHLGAREPEVRISALKALLHLDPTQAAPHLSAAMKDPDAAVRRRAALLAVGLSGEAALTLGLEAVRDSDPEVRGLGALALGASTGEKARAPLLQALRDPELKVRSAAAQSLSRLLGQDVSAVVSLDEAQRAREVRRLSQEPVPTRRAPPRLAAPAPVPAVAALRASVVSLPAAAPRADAAASPARTAAAVHVAVAAAPPPARTVDEALCASLLADIRCSIRGRTVGDLAQAAARPEAPVVEACELLVARAQLVRRGQKYFVA